MEFLVRVGIDLLAPVRAAADNRIGSHSVAAAETVLREADDLLPMLEWEARSDWELTAVVAFGMDGKSLVLHGLSDRQTENSVEVWEDSGNRSSEIVLEWPGRRVNGRRNVAFSGDGKWVGVEASSDNLVRVRSVDRGQVAYEIDPRDFFVGGTASESDRSIPRARCAGGGISENFVVGSAGEARLAGLAFDWDGNHLALISADGRVVVLSLDDGGNVRAVAKPWRLHWPGVDDYMRVGVWRLNRSGELLAATPSSHDIGCAPVGVWKSDTGEELFPSLIHNATVSAVAFAPDGSQLATGTDDGDVFVWDLQSGRQQVFIDMNGPVHSIAFGSGEAEGFLLVGGVNIARVFDVTTRREIVRTSHKGQVRSVVWSERGRYFATGATSEAERGGAPLKAWDVAAAQRMAPMKMRRQGSFDRIAVSGKVIAAIVWPGDVVAWDTSTGTVLGDFEDTYVVRLAVAVDPIGPTIRVLAPKEAGVVYSFDLATGRRSVVEGEGLRSVRLANSEEPWIADAAFDGRGRRLVRLIKRDEECRLDIWDVIGAERMRTLTCAQSAEDAALSRDGEILGWMERGERARVVVRSVEGRSVDWSAEIEGLAGRIQVGRQIAFSGDGCCVVVASGAKLRIFEARTGVIRSDEIDLGAQVMNVALDGEGGHVVAALASRNVVVVNTTTGEEVSSHAVQADGMAGSVVVSEDGDFIYASFGDDNAANPRVWRWRFDLAGVVEALGGRLARATGDGGDVEFFDVIDAPHPSEQP